MFFIFLKHWLFDHIKLRYIHQLSVAKICTEHWQDDRLLAVVLWATHPISEFYMLVTDTEQPSQPGTVPLALKTWSPLSLMIVP